LILALIYIVVISLTVGALASWATNDLNNTNNFQSASSLHFALTAGVDAAIQSIRTTPLPTNPTLPSTGATALGLTDCWTPTANPLVSQLKTDGYTIEITCSTVENLTSASTRVVTFSACISRVNASSTPAAVTAARIACQSSPLLAAEVSFDDYPTGGSVALTQQCNQGNGECGFTETLDSWIWV
jgi:hypothetical protein